MKITVIGALVVLVGIVLAFLKLNALFGGNRADSAS